MTVPLPSEENMHIQCVSCVLSSLSHLIRHYVTPSPYPAHTGALIVVTSGFDGSSLTVTLSLGSKNPTNRTLFLRFRYSGASASRRKTETLK